MEKLKNSYLETCRSFYVEPNDVILGEIQNVIDGKSEQKSLNFSSFQIPEAQCNILGKILSHDFLIDSIYLNDCNLSSEALQALLLGLTSNTTCKTLELKGNRIHGVGTESIAKLLRKNQTLRKLRLEWNQLGAMDSIPFTNFCDALAVNKSLIELDLRNNDISHVGGTELAAALKKNVTLRILDLRWNNIGAIGGRSLLASCQSNSTLNELHLVGNDVPDEILQILAETLSKNVEKRQMHFGHSHQMAIIARQLHNAHTDKDRQMANVLQRVSLQEQAMLKANKSLAEKIRKLQDALDDRKLAFNALSAKNALLEADLTVAQQQFHEAKNELKKLQIDNEHLVKKLQREHQDEKETFFIAQNKIQREFHENVELQRRLNEKIHELERKNETLQNTIHEFRQNITENDRDHHLKIAELDDENQRTKLKHKEEIKDQQLSHQREIQRLKETFSSNEQNFKEQIQNLETIRTGLEREINSLKSTLTTQKIHSDEVIQHEKLRIRNEEEKKQNELEQRIRILINNKEELESKLNQQLMTNREFQQKIQFQTVENETLKRQFESIQLANQTKDTEILEIREKSKTDYEKKFRLIQKDVELNDELKDRVKQLENDLKDQRFNDRNTIRDLETRLADLQQKLMQREHELAQWKNQEEKRLHFLRTTMLDYVNRGNQTQQIT